MKITLRLVESLRPGFVAAIALVGALTPQCASGGPKHFAEWTAGRISSVDSAQHALVLRVEQRDSAETFLWDKDSRLWRTGGPKDGQPVEGGALKVGESVKVQFRESTKGEPMRIVKIVETPGRD